MSDCNICVEKYTKTVRCKIVCHCLYEACRSCIKIYLLSKVENAHCMSCKISWDRSFMSENFEKTFMTKDFKNHRETVLINRELSMLQATQPYVENEINTENVSKIIQTLTDNYYNKHRKLLDEQQKLQNEHQNIINKLQTDHYEKVRELENQNNLITQTTVERKKFIRKCPSGDCHGFLSSGLKCELCENFACANCREVTGKTTEVRQAHKCDPQIVESVKFLENDSKPCPKCASLTFKIIGCDQMFCVECHTPWDWKSGKVVSGQIHNPHYIEFLAQQNNGKSPRNTDDILCGRQIDNNFINELINVFPSKLVVVDNLFITSVNKPDKPYKEVQPNKECRNFIEIARNIIHIRLVEIIKFNVDDQLQHNLQMRIDFMRNKIDKEYFKKTIQKKEKENEKKKELHNLLGMYINCMTDIFYRLKPINSIQIKDEMNILRNYTNKCFLVIGKSFNSKIYHINNEYVFDKK